MEPPRGLSCLAVNRRFPSRSDQYGASMQLMEPVTGSSSMPTEGAKKRQT